MRISQLALSALMVLSLIQPVLAQNLAQNFPQFPFGTLYSPEALATFLGVPPDWLAAPKVIYYVIVPFIVAVTVTYGILVELNIFRSSRAYRVNIILSVAMSFLLLPSGILTIIVTYFYAAGTFIGLIGFGILFIFGVIAWVYGSSHRIWGEQVPKHIQYGKQINQRMRELNNEIRRLEDRRSAAVMAGKDDKTIQHIAAMKLEKEGERDKLQEQWDKLKYGH